MSAIDEAQRAGIDLSLIDENLRLTPEQRAVQHQAGLEMALQLDAAYRASDPHEGTQPTSADISGSTSHFCEFMTRKCLSAVKLQA